MEAPEPTAAVSEETKRSQGDDRYDYTEFTYENGVRLRVIPNTQNAGLVVIDAASPGGVARVPDDDVIDATYAGEIALNSGVGPFNQADVDTILADTDFGVWAWSRFYSDHLYAESTSSELDDTFQYIHLLMTQPRFDQVALDQTIAGNQALVDDPSINPDAARFDALGELRYGDDPRFATIPTPAQFATLDLQGAARVWNDRFGDASDWLFIMYGDVTVDEARELGAAYLANLPGGDGESAPLVDDPGPIVGISERTVEAGEGQTAATTFYFTTPVDTVTDQLRAEADLSSQVVSARLTNVLREEFGETYSPWVGVWFSGEPTPFVEANIDVTAAPDAIDRVTGLLLAELDDLATNGPGATELELARSVVGESYGWKGPSQITTDLLNADLFDGFTLDDYLVTSRFDFDDWPIDAADVRDFVAAYLPTDRYVNAVSVPR
jgi:zinc protease